MSTTVYFIELIMVSLVFVMVVKLFTQYKNWQRVSIFSVKSGTQKVIPHNNISIEYESENPIADSNGVRDMLSDYTNVSEVKNQDSIQAESHSSILDEYIGEFFIESVNQPFQFKADKFETNMSIQKVDNMDEVIKVKSNTSLEAQPTIENDSLKTHHVIPSETSECSDSEIFITVLSENDEYQGKNKVMSNKVVLAMLDEAKSACAS